MTYRLDPTQLLKASVYPHPVESVRMLETHISWVFLTGDYAYKIKKPVDFGFLDYSSLDRRKFFCHEEFRLNRRLNHQLYVDVLPLTKSSDGLKFGGGEGETVEWAVRMQQFPQECLYSQKFADGRLGAEQLDPLARFVAQFHRQAQAAEVDSAYGTPQKVQAPCLDNFVDLLRLEPALELVLVYLRDWTTRAFERLETTLRARKEEFFI